MTERVDVVVVGGGAMGSAAAWWLARRGHDVVLLEQFEAGHLRGSSHGTTRIFRNAYADAHYVRMAREALLLWRELEEDAGCTLLEITGGIDHGPAAVVERIAAALIGESVAREVLTPAAASERWPTMRFDEAVLFHPEAGRCLADATLAALHQRAAVHGADLRFGTGPAVIGPLVDPDGVTVRAADTQWRARAVVVTAGAWAAPVLAGAVDLPPLTVTREQVQHFTPLDPAADWPSFLHHRASDPVVYGLRSATEGVKVAAHHAGPSFDPANEDRSVDPAQQAAMARYVGEWFPGVDPEPRLASSCLYTSTADEHFVIDRVGPVVVGSPCSGHGFKFTPLIGRMLANLADGTTAEPDQRFALPRR